MQPGSIAVLAVTVVISTVVAAEGQADTGLVEDISQIKPLFNDIHVSDHLHSQRVKDEMIKELQVMVPVMMIKISKIMRAAR